MFRFITTNRPLIIIDRYKFILLISLFLVYIENIFAISNKFYINKVDALLPLASNIFYLLCESFLALIITLLLLIVFSFNRYLLKIVISILLIFNAAFLYYIFADKIIINDALIANILQASPMEVSELFSPWAVVVTIIFGLIPTGCIWFFVKFKPYGGKFNNLLSVRHWLFCLKGLFFFALLPIALLYTFLLIFNPQMVNNKKLAITSIADYQPINYIAAIEQYATILKKSLKEGNNLVLLPKEFSFKFNNSLKHKPLTIVLVIGETDRAKNQHYMGYFRNTNLYTEKLPNLVYFKNMISCGTYTTWSVPCLLSYKSRAEFKEPIHETNLISVFKSLGFKTWWLSGQQYTDPNYNILYATGAEADKSYWLNDLRAIAPSNTDAYDELLVRLLNQALKNPEQHKFIVIQLHGSHPAYKARYPKSFKVFKPSCNDKACTEEAQRNDYDNSLLYSDYVLSQIIKRLQKQNAYVLYTSDHGESLAVDHSGFLLHSAPYNIAPIDQKHAAAFMWFSPSMRKILPTAFNSVEQYANKAISHDNVFSTMLGCIGVTSKVVHNNLNLCENSK